MKISNNPNVHQILKVYQKNSEKYVNKAEKTSQKKDQIEISEKARDFQVALNAYKKLPDIRKEKVEEISKQIRAGNYNPSAEEIVESMFDKKI
jgi:negative regulator of flagellin synthesis FlgM